MTKASQVRDVLRTIPEIEPHVRGTAVRKLIEAGHIEDDLAAAPAHVYANKAQSLSKDAAERLSALKSSISAADSARIDPDRVPALTRVRAILRRAGYPLADNEIVDAFRLDSVLAKSSESIEGRIALKIEMGRLGLLPRLS
jgi:hypothetical protein